MESLTDVGRGLPVSRILRQERSRPLADGGNGEIPDLQQLGLENNKEQPNGIRTGAETFFREIICEKSMGQRTTLGL